MTMARLKFNFHRALLERAQEGEMDAQTIRAEMERTTHQRFSMTPIYRSLLLLTDLGFLAAERRKITPGRGGAPRFFYTLTDKGRATLREEGP